MITDKQAAIALVSSLPNDISTETIVATLNFKLLMLRRRQSARGGGTVSHDEAKRRLARWLR